MPTAKAAAAKAAPKTAGQPLKVAFKLDPEELKTLRRKMRAAIRDKDNADGRILAAHRIGSGRWVVSPKMKAAASRVLNG